MTPPPPPGAAIDAVRIERRGGLAGLRLSAEHDYSDLTARQRHALDGLLSNVTPTATVPTGNDRFSYCIRVRHAGGGERLLEVSEEAMPSSLAPLAKPTLPG